MSDIKTTLTELVRYYDSNRGVGHTTAVIAGAENMEGCVMVAATQADVKRLAEGEIFKVITLSQLEDGVAHGLKLPMVLDNHALTELARQSLGEIARLEDKIVKMRNAAQAIADTHLHD